jgi:CDP-2,3-bis-(O-geranylgeranyl)-sn-glycerol synthase
MLDIILKSAYLLLPAYFANASASLSSNVKFLKKYDLPLDFYQRLRGNYILGPGKTFRGTIIGLVFGILTALLQLWLFNFNYFHSLSIINYQQINIFLFGLLAGLGTMAGDAVASFFKRRFNFKSGSSLPPLDQWDFIIGFFLLTSILVKIDKAIIFYCFIITLIIHPISNIIGYKLHLKKVWW